MRRLTARQVEHFRSCGYLALDRLVGEREVTELRALYDRILADPKVFSIRFDEGGIHQVMSPDVQYPELRETACFRNGRRLACQLLGIAEEELEGFFTHLIYKPPRSRRDTPWHQDEAYWNNLETSARSLSVWLPLDPVHAESGCMQFVPGSHATDVRRHRRQCEIPPLLVIDEDVDLASAVACPLTAGGATFHHCRTLHYTAPNSSDAPRRAWSLVFHAVPVLRDVPLEKPWLTFDAGPARP